MASGAELSAQVRAILARAAGGETLSVEDRVLLAEAAGIENSAGVRGREAAEDFSLSEGAGGAAVGAEGAGPGGGEARWPYRQRAVDYAATYQTHLRNIRAWVKRGRLATPPDLPPLDRPAEMPSWWTRRMEHRVPEKLLVAASAAAAIAPGQSPAPDAPAPDAAREGDEAGMGATVRRLREAEREAGAAYAAALVPTKGPDGKPQPVDQGTVALLQKRWADIVDALRKAANDDAKLAEARGEVLDRKAAARELREIHAGLAQDFRGLVRRAWPKLAGKPEPEARLIWEAEAERLFAELPAQLGLIRSEAAVAA